MDIPPIPKVVALIFLTLIAYAPSIHDGFVWDDDNYAQNPILAVPGGLSNIWTFKEVPTYRYYREFPATYTVFWLERRLWGLRPIGFHLVNIGLHSLNAVFVWRILTALEAPGAWFASAVFAIHPIQVESVVWISELKNILSGFFYLAALLLYWRYEKSGRRAFYAGTIALFSIALLAKVTVCTWPVAVLLLRWYKDMKIRARDFAKLTPFFLLAFAAGFGALAAEHDNVGTEPVFALSFFQRLLLAGHAFWFYPMKFLWPT